MVRYFFAQRTLPDFLTTAMTAKMVNPAKKLMPAAAAAILTSTFAFINLFGLKMRIGGLIVGFYQISK